MKGIIFTTLSQMVEERFGLEMWDKVLLDANPPSQGIYTAGAMYPDSELFGLITSLSRLTKVPPNMLVREYGEFLFEKLASSFPELIPQNATLKEFLMSIDKVIHVEVFKLDPNAQLPSIKYEDPSPKQLVLLYSSPRKLCTLAEGLMRGASKHFNEALEIQETRCMHTGSDHCRFELTFK